MTDLMNPPIVDMRALTRKVSNKISDSLESMSDEAQMAALDLLNSVRQMPLRDRGETLKMIADVFKEVDKDNDGTKDAALVLAISTQRKLVKMSVIQ